MPSLASRLKLRRHRQQGPGSEVDPFHHDALVPGSDTSQGAHNARHDERALRLVASHDALLVGGPLRGAQSRPSSNDGHGRHAAAPAGADA